MATPFPVEHIAPPEAEVPAEIMEQKPQYRERLWGHNARADPTVSFLEFQYWAKQERAEEIEIERKFRELEGPWSFKKMIADRFSSGTTREEQKKQLVKQAQAAARAGDGEKTVVVGETSSITSSEEEWRTAARAMRTASWGSIFFLVTTDILGWSSCPFVFASVGYGPGVGVYLIFGLAAAFSGFMLWSVFMNLDSTRFPMVSFGDLFLRVFGVKMRHFINVTQSLQQFCSVMVLILGNGTVISQLAGPGLCFIACMIIAMVVGMVGGSIRSLQKLGWICNLSVWMNIVSFIIIMVASKYHPIDYAPAWGSTLLPKGKKIPVHTFANIPPNQFQQQAHGFAAVFNGIDSMVYAYSGAILFVAFMAEMRHPMDFWKGMILAQAFICSVYILFGAYVYSNYGQYAISNINNVIQPYSLQTVGNVFTLLTGLIAIILYYNVGMKTVYLEVFEEIFKFPPISTKKGRFLWFGLGPLYWIVAFLVAAAVPNLSGIVNFVGGLLSVNFTYAFPALLYLGWNIVDGATLPGEEFNPYTGETSYQDAGIKRLIRGYIKRWYINVPVTLYMLASFATSGMGTWAAVEGLIVIFGPQGTVATSFGCPSPVWG